MNLYIFAEMLRDFLKYYAEGGFDKAKKVSDFVGMIARLVFVFILYKFIILNYNEGGFFHKIFIIPVLIFLLVLYFHLIIFVSTIIMQKSTKMLVRLFGDKMSDDNWSYPFGSLLVIVLISAVNWGVGDVVTSFSEGQLGGQEIKLPKNEEIRKLVMPPPPIFVGD